MAKRNIDFDSDYLFSFIDDEVKSTDLKLAKTYYGDFLGDSLSVDLDKNGKYVNFNLLFVNEVYHSKPSFERSSEIFEQSAKYTFEQTDEFLSRFKLYYYSDNVTFVFDNDSVVDAIGVEDNVEYGYSDDKLLYVTISGISPEDMKKMEDKFKESGIDIIENKDFFTKVDSLANKNDVDVLSSTLIGSRSWGYSDSNSDYDVRFVYKRGLSDYIGIEEKNDTITPAIEDGYDIQGYDVRKFIKLIVSQNPIIYEILNSSDQNEEYDPFYYKIWGFSNEVFDKKKMIQKYQGIILNKISELKSSPKKPLKLYIYILRMIGIVNFIEDKGMFPTCTIENVFSSESNLEYKDIIESLVDLKVHSKNVVIDDEAIKYLENALNKTKERMPNEDLGLSSKDIYEKSNKLIYDLLVTSTKKDELKGMFDDSSDVNVDGSVKK